LQAALLLVGVTVLLAGPAWARNEVLRWQHPNAGQVASFNVHVGQSSGSYTQTIPVGKPSPSGGVYTATITVANGDDAYVAISATGTNGLVSAVSNERFRPASTTPPPPPPPTPLGTPGKPAVIGN